ncbi:LysR substrate-binding domain-containing protein [Lentzea cavernae]|uniref:LysR family transcriptional regulator n=1 Tax=Lentzea cavernae TaxID=2020703 RepID=A0ABQ3MF09_9PSEU|nr:LysR substrate-binding domain-containing protein [Lentzea cavernae]GHH40357.1 LysR family transcriptional regulator [Lentzea cavernae]
MELRHLRYFVAVAEERHFGRAAARLNMAQPPLSQQIQQLEAELGVTLLHRTTRKVELTGAGAVYLERARAVLAAVDDAAAEAQRVAKGLQGRLVVGCVGSATYSLLPAFARALRDALPAVDFTFRGEMLAPDQLDSLLGSRIDLALLRPPVDHSAVRVTTVRRDRLIVALPEDHPLAHRERLEVADLREQDLIVHASRGRSVMHGIVTDLCRSAGFEARIRHEVEETSTLVTFVASGLGVAVVPQPVAELGVPGATYRPLAGDQGVDLVAAVRADDDSPVLARALGLLARWQEGTKPQVR